MYDVSNKTPTFLGSVFRVEFKNSGFRAFLSFRQLDLLNLLTSRSKLCLDFILVWICFDFGSAGSATVWTEPILKQL